ncbi:hypothetical protein GCM10011504_48250 [Siccirubricoccus deserti]|uniref:Calcium-binding protein n=1 Tax=Siccirubricoccus deserti TaxID=2013562 RepID=A0A9X0R4K3_9PROT|nr:hypothetical protein [Siccirubricoccus deserti]MBC4018257.1 hypothetical protein [Siccirubricoccus deserti]GGC64468.1 hypothetical protein GCM10011504_48250 [Siccirubricoccus deserti]
MAIILARRAGSDPLTGASTRDVIIGSDKADLIGGREGDDWILARSGNDRIYGDNIGEPGGPFEVGPPPIQFGGEPGNNVIFAGGSNDFVTAGFGADVVFGGGGNDEIRGYGVFDGTIAAADIIAADGRTACSEDVVTMWYTAVAATTYLLVARATIP